MSMGPPPPDARPPMDPQTPPMPPSIVSQQAPPSGVGMGGDLQKQTMDMAVQKLLEFKNVVEGLLTAMKAIDPESVSLFIPAIEVGKALESRLKQASERVAAKQPSMAGMPGGQSPNPPPPGGASAMGA